MPGSGNFAAFRATLWTYVDLLEVSRSGFKGERPTKSTKLEMYLNESKENVSNL